MTRFKSDLATLCASILVGFTGVGLSIVATFEASLSAVLFALSPAALALVLIADAALSERREAATTRPEVSE